MGIQMPRIGKSREEKWGLDGGNEWTDVNKVESRVSI